MAGLKFKDHVRDVRYNNFGIDRHNQAARDLELIEVIKNPARKVDELRAWKGLLEQYSHDVAWWSQRFEYDLHLREDLVQEIMLKVYERLSFYKPEAGGGTSFRTWLYRVALDKGKDWRRAQDRRIPEAECVEYQEAEATIPAEVLMQIDTPEEAAFYADTHEIIDRVLRTLPKGVIEAYNMEQSGLSHTQIDQHFGYQAGQARKRCYKARQHIKLALEEQ